jgi:hypothetical protein
MPVTVRLDEDIARFCSFVKISADGATDPGDATSIVAIIGLQAPET